MNCKAQINGIGQAATEDFDSELAFTAAIISDEHSASSYGLPVVLIGGHPFGPNDLAARYGVYYVRPETMIDADARLAVLLALQKAGYRAVA